MVFACRPPPQAQLVACGTCRRLAGRCSRRARLAISCTRSCGFDVLLVDAQNVLSRAHADHRRGGRLQGDTAPASFADWLRFLAALAEPQLLVAVFDAPSARRTQQPQQREQLAPEYLQRRKRRKQQQQQQPAVTRSSFEQPPPAPAGGDPLRPFKQQVEQLGGVCLEATGGWEADDGLAAASAVAQQRHPWARLLIASGDQDMQQLLAPQVGWLQLHNQTSLECPLGIELVTAAQFEQQYGFPPAAYPDWQAFAGKKDSGIRGAEVGSKTAAKLLARYGSLESVLAAAEAGKLNGWGPTVQKLLSGGGGSSSTSGGGGISPERQAHLRRNRKLFVANADPVVVDGRGMQRMVAALQRLQPASAVAAGSPSSNGGSSRGGIGSGGIVPTAELAWQHPLHARRWRQQQQLAGSTLSQHAATPQGLAVDELCQAGGVVPSGCATFYLCPCDMPAGGWQAAVQAAAQEGEHADLTGRLMPLLHGAMRHHVKLVKRAGYRVRLALVDPGALAGVASAD